MRSREFDLAAALCRWPPSPARDSAARSAAAGPLDWHRLERIVRRHRVEGLVHAALKAADLRPPISVGTIISVRAAQIARTNLEQAREAIRIARALRASGIRPLFLKGTTLALLAYGRIDLKHALDIDLLVLPQEARAAVGELLKLGYRPAKPTLANVDRLFASFDLLKDCELQHATSRINVELHWRMFDTRQFLPLLAKSGLSQSVDVGPARLRTFDDLGLFTYLCGHGIRHGWARLKWLADLNALLSHRDADQIEALYAQSVSIGAGRAPAVALLLCADVLGLPLRAAFADRLRSDRVVRWLQAVAIRGMIATGESGSERRALAALTVEASQFLLGLGGRHILDVLHMKWIGNHERLALPLPKPLHFLYAFLRPPLWVARRVRTLFTVAMIRRLLGRTAR